MKNSELLEQEELIITTQNWPREVCPYDPERIPQKGQWKFEVSITKKAQERNLTGPRKAKEGVSMYSEKKMPMKFETVFDTYTAAGIIGNVVLAQYMK